MKEPTFDVATSIGDFLANRRAFLGKAGALSVGALVAAIGGPTIAGASSSSPPPATFTTLLGLCAQGSVSETYTPGVTNTLQSIQTSGSVTFSPCAVAQNKVVTGVQFTYSGIGSCSQVTDAGGSGVIIYSGGPSSNYTLDSWQISRLFGQAVGVMSGVITNGPFNGARMWGFGTRVHSNPSTCATSGGITQQNGTTTLLIAQ